MHCELKNTDILTLLRIQSCTYGILSIFLDVLFSNITPEFIVYLCAKFENNENRYHNRSSGNSRESI